MLSITGAVCCSSKKSVAKAISKLRFDLNLVGGYCDVLEIDYCEIRAVVDSGIRIPKFDLWVFKIHVDDTDDWHVVSSILDELLEDGIVHDYILEELCPEHIVRQN